MEYIRPNIRNIDLENFDYPRLCVSVSKDNSGNLDDTKFVTVFYQEPFGTRWRSRYLFQKEEHLVDLSAVRKEVDEFNKDLVGNWDKMIHGVIEQRLKLVEANIADQVNERVTLESMLARFKNV